MRLMKYPFLLLLIFVDGHQVLGQSTDERGDQIEIRSWIGYSRNSVVFLGKTSDTETTIIGVGIRKFIKSTSDFDIYYTADLIPYLFFKYPKRDDGNRIDRATGFAISPVGFEFERSLNNALALRISTSGSFAYMDRTFPTDKGRKLNFTFDISPAFTVRIAPLLSATLGYKFHHISNAQTGTENPGIDSNFMFFSLQFN